ncbi:MAG TPA: ABC transporter permease [Chloroflexota bacterium]|nr:ABC transporter permease [Chloroflexota bacterium]
MFRYVLAKLILTIPLLLGVTFALFVIGQITPGDPVLIMLGERALPEEAAQLRASLGLDQPWYVQYFQFVGNLLRGDLGISYRSKLPVAQEVISRLPATVELASAALVFAVIIGLSMGIISAVKRNTIFDRLAILLAMLGASMPVFWSGLLLIVLFAVNLGWLPASGRGTPAHLIMPAIALGAGGAALIARITRSSMLESLSQDYVRTARAKGLGEQIVILRHALKNALIPVVTVVGLQIGGLLGGAVLTETVFSWPGIGLLTVQAIGQRDFPVLRASVLLVATIFTLINLGLDILFVQLDPRIKYR